MNYDLWARHITTPYLPVVGLVHPDCTNEATLRAVVQSLASGVRPSFDKSLRWGREHPERLAAQWFVQTNSATTIFARRNDVLTAYIYTRDEEQLESLVRKARAAKAAKIYTFSTLNEPGKAHISHGFLGEVTKQTGESKHVRPVSNRSQELDQLKALDNGKEMAGLAFLATQIAEREDIGPTLGYFADDILVGAIGPLGVAVDSLGRKYLLPPYLGVHKSMRGKGAGRALWKAAMNYAAEQGAVYVLVQAEDGAESERFYKSEHMKAIGSLYMLVA